MCVNRELERGLKKNAMIYGINISTRKINKECKFEINDG